MISKETHQVDWIGKLPKNWEHKPLRNLTYFINDNNSDLKFTNVLSLLKDIGVVPYEEKGNQGNKSKEDLSNYKLAYKNTIVVNSMNLKIGSVGLSKYDGCVSPVYYVLGIRKGNNIHYVNYLFQTREFQEYLGSFGRGIMEIREKISKDDMKIALIPKPPLATQDRIVEYLEKKIAIIDDQVAKNKKAIELLVEYRASVIDAKSQPNSNWRIEKLKYHFEFSKGLSITKENLVEEGLPVISYGQIHSKTNLGTTITDDLIRYVPNEYLENTNALVYKGDFIFADTSEDLEGVGNCVYNDKDSAIFAGYHTIILRAKNKNMNFFSYLFKSNYWRSQLRSMVNGTKLYSITQGLLNQVKIYIPPLSEQKEIVSYLDKKCKHTDKVIAYRKAIIEKLEEYKKSLIFEVVTGKKDV